MMIYTDLPVLIERCEGFVSAFAFAFAAANDRSRRCRM